MQTKEYIALNPQLKIHTLLRREWSASADDGSTSTTVGEVMELPARTCTACTAHCLILLSPFPPTSSTDVALNGK